MKKNYVVFLDIENEYTDYAECIRIIKNVIDCKTIDFEKKNRVIISFYEYRMNVVTPNKLEEPLDGINMTSSISKVSSREMITNQIIYNSNLHFHVRISFKKSAIEINKMHYISMLLLSNKNLIEQGRLSVFLVPRSGSTYPFSENNSTDTLLYEYASAYLRTLIGSGNKGIIYGVCKAATSKDANIVKALDFKCAKRNEDYFPLIVLNQVKKENADIIEKYTMQPKVGKSKVKEKLDTSCLNHYAILFRQDIVISYYCEAMKLHHPYRFGYANSESPELSVSDFVFETSFNCLSSKFGEKGIILNTWKDNKEFQMSYQCFDVLLQKSSIFSLAIFSFLFSFPEELTDSNTADLIRKYGELSLDLSDAFNQIIQNSLLHSTNHLCAITLYKDSVSNNGTNKNLRIIVSDLSDKTIIDTFTDNLAKEKLIVNKLMQIDCLHLKMINIEDDIYCINNYVLSNIEKLNLKCFFNDFSNEDSSIINLWKKYREVDSSAHIGLAMFSKILNRCGASFAITSNSSYEYKPENMYTNICNNINDMFGIIIPGTEFNVIVPLELKNDHKLNGISQLNYKNYTDNYDSYAHFLNFEVSEIIINENHRNNFKELFKSAKHVMNGELDKFSQQFMWTNFWLEVLISNICLNKNAIKIIDFSKIPFKNNYLEEGVHRREVLVKGLINALGIYASDHTNKYIAITKLNKNMIKTFRDIMISLSIKKFPENLQLFLTSDILEGDMVQMHLTGSSYGISLQNSYVIAISNGVDSISDKEYRIISDLIAPFPRESYNKRKTYLAPFSSFIYVEKDPETCSSNLFFEALRLTAEKDMTSGEGYKIMSSHTRLGNKIHIDAFYEMSYLFYRTILANRVAFEIIRSIINDREIDILNDNILFYGYASYSQAILMSLVNVLRIYRQRLRAEGKTEYAIYQYNLQSESDSEEIQVYLNNRKYIDSNFKVVQIVPISSTLTTFEKMWAKFNYTYNKNNLFVLAQNHTVMWIRDDINKKKEEIKCNANGDIDINVEKEYFNEPKNGTVQALFDKTCYCNRINYIIEGHSYWERPDKCKKCYPDELINEIPLVETDPTSTVPSQQIYLKSHYRKNVSIDGKNISRLSKLKDFIHYQHVKRGKNHFQYYINTHGYFSQVEAQVKQWLEELSNSSREKWDIPYLSIIFSPEHNTNVGFSQYVNAYYFNGNAEIISINEDKEFRSNFICEHSSLKNIIENLFKRFYTDNNFKPVKFYFVDDNIITGSTFYKSNSLLLSIIPEKYQKLYAPNVFEECFFLIDRLSDSSKRTYVYPTNKFHSFCHINVSNTRKQGDSCIGCKMLWEARRLSTISATHYSADYWSKKIVAYEAESFDRIEDTEDSRSYYMLILSHILNDLFKDNSLQDEQNYFKIIRTIFKYFTDVKCDENNEEDQKIYRFLDEYSNSCLLSDSTFDDKRMLLECLIKVLTRPFFTFNQAIKKQILKIMIIISETLLNNICNEDYDCTIFIDRILKLYDDPRKKLKFIISVVFRSLVDLHSTYIIRRKTIISALCFCQSIVVEQQIENNPDLENSLHDFWMKYSIYIQKVINCSSDETRSLWFERLLLCGNETSSFNSESQHIVLFDSVVNELSQSLNQKLEMFFKVFCNETFLNNGHILYQAIKHITNNRSINNNISNSYFLNRWREFRKVDYFSLKYNSIKNQNDYENEYVAEVSFGKYMRTFQSDENKVQNSKGSVFIRTRYNNMLMCIKEMIINKYKNYVKDNVDLAIFTGFGMNEEDIQQLHDLELIANLIYNDINREQAEIKYSIKKRMLKILLDPLASKDLKEYGYYVFISDMDYKDISEDVINTNNEENNWNSNDDETYFILRFEVTDNMLKADKELKSIVPVYMYVKITATKKTIENRLIFLILREVLTYRHNIIKNLIADFTSDVLQRYAHSLGTETILRTEKAISHSPINDDIQQLKLLKSDGVKTCSDLNLETLLKWVLVRNYCNNMTARLYNRVMHNINKDLNTIIKDRENSIYKEALKLYVQSNQCDGNSIPLENISDLLPTDNYKDSIRDEVEDYKSYVKEIFQLFSSIINFKVDDSLMDKKIVSQQSENKYYTYNYTYTINIIIRICLDALRFCKGAGAENNDYKQRIINCYEHVKKSKIKTNIKGLLQPYDGKACDVSFSYEKSDTKYFDWLIIKNRIDVPGSDISNITKKLSDPLDFLDGHMSLLAEKEYMSKLFDFNTEQYIIDNMFKINNNYFETRLPLIKKEE